MRAKKLKIVIPKDEYAVTDLKGWMKNFLENNPFYPEYPYSRLTKKHKEQMEKDNLWYQQQMGLIEVQELEEAPF